MELRYAQQTSYCSRTSLQGRRRGGPSSGASPAIAAIGDPSAAPRRPRAARAAGAQSKPSWINPFGGENMIFGVIFGGRSRNPDCDTELRSSYRHNISPQGATLDRVPLRSVLRPPPTWKYEDGLVRSNSPMLCLNTPCLEFKSHSFPVITAIFQITCF